MKSSHSLAVAATLALTNLTFAAAPAVAAAPTATKIHCHSADQATALFVDLQAGAGEPNILVLQNGETLATAAKPFHVLVGKPNTRLAGLTWYQAGLFEDVEVEVYVGSESLVFAGLAISGGSGTVKVNGTEYNLSCTVL